MTQAVWYCPICQAEATDASLQFCANDGARLRPLVERGAEWVGRVIAGKYRVIRFIAAGGMAEVFEAKHEEGDRRFAIKLMHTSMPAGPEHRQRFRQEAQLVSMIAHPNVVALQDFGTLDDGTDYMVMELLSGHPLSEAIAAGSLSVRRALEITLQVCEGLAAAHERGVVHRDVKPDNIFLHRATPEAEPVVKLLDLGVAKFHAPSDQQYLTQVGVIVGTPAYMAPEQCMGASVGPSADIYALGVVLYEMLWGHPPFEAETFWGVITKHVSEPPQWDRRLADERGIPPAAEELVLRALAKAPADRQESMVDLQMAVAAVLSRVRHGEAYSVRRVAPIARAAARPTLATTATTSLVRLSESDANHDGVVEIVPDVYWVGRRHGSRLECNAYLRVFRAGGEAVSVLIDPGPPQDLEALTAKVTRVLGSLDRLDYVFLNHQDPDVSANAAALQQANRRVRIICSLDTWRLARFYGLDPARFIAVEGRQDARLVLPTGHAIEYVPTPFCHFRGAVMLYDVSSRVLFSGDLFGGASTSPSLIGGEQSMPGVALFHQLYMPSKRALLRAVARTRGLSPFPRVIAPQHGALLLDGEVASMLDWMDTLEVGMDLIESNERDPRFRIAGNAMMQAYASIVGDEKARAFLAGHSSDGTFSNLLELDEAGQISAFRVDPQLALDTLLFDAVAAAPEPERSQVPATLRDTLRRSLRSQPWRGGKDRS